MPGSIKPVSDLTDSPEILGGQSAGVIACSLR